VQAKGTTACFCGRSWSERHSPEHCPKMAWTCSHRDDCHLCERDRGRREKSCTPCLEFVGTCYSRSNTLIRLKKILCAKPLLFACKISIIRANYLRELTWNFIAITGKIQLKTRKGKGIH
jgi:hypothetical protein